MLIESGNNVKLKMIRFDEDTEQVCEIVYVWVIIGF